MHARHRLPPVLRADLRLDGPRMILAVARLVDALRDGELLLRRGWVRLENGSMYHR